MITIDERGCGLGKTTDGIFKRIRANTQHNINTLVVVPSIALQHQYQSGLDLPVDIINSSIYNQDNYDCSSVVKATLNAMRLGTKIIIITHQAFVKLPDIGLRRSYDLIIDEALEDIIHISKVACANPKQWKPDYDIRNLFHFENDIIEQIVDISNDDDTYYELTQIRSPVQSMLSESPSFNTITDRNFIHHITSKGWKILNNQDGGVAQIISVLNPVLFDHWRGVHIAAAAFSKTKMYHWMKANNMQMYIPTSYRFTPHSFNIKIHSSNQPNFKWSNTKRKDYPEIISRYHQYVQQNATGRILSIRNNAETQKMGAEERINHNVHGQNKYQDYTNVSLESALIPDPCVRKWLNDNWFAILTKDEANKALTHMFSAYLFYQTAMRTKLRSRNYTNELINIFVLDQDTAVCLMYYFDSFQEIGEMDITSGIEKKKMGRPSTPIEIKKAQKKEQNRRFRAKGSSESP